MDFHSCLKEVELALGLTNWIWKDKQIECLRAVYNGNNVAAVLPTGYGKSVIFQSLPYMIAHRDSVENVMVIVVTPLNAIMMDQCQKLTTRGVKSCYLDFKCTKATSTSTKKSGLDLGTDHELTEDQEAVESDVALSSIEEGLYRIVYAHPESLLCSTGRALMRKIREHVVAVAVDESHIVLEWGDDFRTDFTRIGSDLLPLFTKAQTILLTATASQTDLMELIKKMNLPNKPEIITANPDRPNITFIKAKRSPSNKTQDHLDELLTNICAEIKEKGQDFPLTLVYTDTDVIGYAYWFLEQNLDVNYQFVGPPEPENRVFAQYHKGYTKQMKRHIVHELCSQKPKLKIVFSTVALGMGLDSAHIRHIIHYKAPTTLQKYFQECGRAGRDGMASMATLYYNNTDVRSNRPGLQQEMAKFCREENKCLREMMLNFFGHEADPTRNKATCCSVCNKDLLLSVIDTEFLAVSTDSDGILNLQSELSKLNLADLDLSVTGEISVVDVKI